jgi:hypothetical protein
MYLNIVMQVHANSRKLQLSSVLSPKEKHPNSCEVQSQPSVASSLKLTSASAPPLPPKPKQVQEIARYSQ